MSALGDEGQRQMGREFGARWDTQREAIVKQSKVTKSKSPSILPEIMYSVLDEIFSLLQSLCFSSWFRVTLITFSGSLSPLFLFSLGKS